MENGVKENPSKPLRVIDVSVRFFFFFFFFAGTGGNPVTKPFSSRNLTPGRVLQAQH